MDKEQIREKLLDLEKQLSLIGARYHKLAINEKKEKLEKETGEELFWKRPDQADLLRQLKYYSEIFSIYNNLVKMHGEYTQLFHEEFDEEMLYEIEKDLSAGLNDAKNLEISLLLNKEEDKKFCFLDINSGAGGTEAQDWAEMLLRMYVRFCERENFSFKIIDYIAGEGAGIKSATIYIGAEFATGLLESEKGIHRLVRVSPFDANQRRHTSFAAVMITPEAPDISVEILPTDLKIDTFRAGGAGGQHVNKTDSAVRITHLPTNIVVQCQNERSQMQNRETAMKMLRAKLFQRERDLLFEKQKQIEKKKIEWGSQVRSYVLHPYKMVKDHRTNHESAQPDKVLDGDIMTFIEKYLIMRE